MNVINKEMYNAMCTDRETTFAAIGRQCLSKTSMRFDGGGPKSRKGTRYSRESGGRYSISQSSFLFYNLLGIETKMDLIKTLIAGMRK